jgi:uncharacterized cupredoxin-like copper-binding protein
MVIHRIALAFLAAVVIVAGCGGGGSHDHASQGNAAGSPRTVDVEMRDIAYVPASVSVRTGETVKFVFHNRGQAVHEAFIGDEAAQKEHENEMRGEGMNGAGMNSTHHDDEAVRVEPGKTATLTHTFSQAGPVLIGCHEPGHYAAGMKLAVTVS